MLKKISLLTFLLVFLAVPVLHAQPMRSMQAQNRVNLAVQLGIGGSADIEIDGNDAGDGDLNSTFGAMAEYLLPLHRIFALGARFQFFSVDADGGGDNVNHIAFSAVPKLRLPATPTMEIHLAIPLGLAIGFPPDDFGDDVGTGFGFQWGLLVGGTLNVSPGIGLFGEAGLMSPSTTYTADTLAGDVDLTLTAQQFTFFAGVAIDI